MLSCCGIKSKRMFNNKKNYDINSIQNINHDLVNNLKDENCSTVTKKQKETLLRAFGSLKSFSYFIIALT